MKKYRVVILPTFGNGYEVSFFAANDDEAKKIFTNTCEEKTSNGEFEICDLFSDGHRLMWF